MATANEIVVEQFGNAESYAEAALEQLEDFLAQLNDAIYVAPLIDIEWATIEAPTATEVPDIPTALDGLESQFAFDESILDARPEALTLVAPTIDIDDFDEEAPTIDLSNRPDLSFPDAPTVSLPDAPDAPTLANITVPDAPTITFPDAPELLELSTPTLDAVNLRADYLSDLEATDTTLELLVPTAYEYTAGPQYTSALMTALTSALTTRIAGGTGLAPAVETAIWGRGADRESKTMQATVDEATSAHQALGWSLPSAHLSAAIRRATEAVRSRSADLSREVSIEQAKLELANVQKTIDQVIQWEGQLIERSLRLETIAFESAKYTAENAIALYNAQVERFRALLQAFQVRAAIYDTIIKGELAKVDVYKAELLAEQTKAEVNKALIAQYQAEIDARLAIVRVYEGQLAGTKALVEVEGLRIQAFGEQVKAHVATINGETAKMEVYKIGVQAEGLKAEAFRTDVQAQLGGVQAYSASADAYRAKVGGQAERARAEIALITGLAQAKSSEFDGFRALVGAERERIASVGEHSRALLSAYDARIRGIEAQINQDNRRWETSIKQYEAQQQYTINGFKLNSDVIAANNQSRLDAAKTGAQILAQVTGSALGMIHTSAGISAGASTSVSYSYSNDTTTSPSGLASI